MSFLRRRIDHLLQLMSEGKFHIADTFPKVMLDQLKKECAAVRRNAEGVIDLDSCGPALRSMARMVYSIKDFSPDASAAPSKGRADEPSPADLMSLQHEYFSIIDEFVARVLGADRGNVLTADQFDTYVRENADEYAPRFEKAFPDFVQRFEAFYKRDPASIYTASRSLGGVKLVVGGSQRFEGTTLDAVKSMLLYADTILIPDPILPWLETPRPEERFGMVLPFKAAFLLSQLRPLVDAELPYPAISVFPSWEKTLEASDETTQDNMGRFALEFFSFYLGARLEDESELFEFAESRSTEFLERVGAGQLFVAPGGTGRESIDDAIQIYRDQRQLMRSKEYNEQFAGVPDGVLVAMGILERLQPQFHLLENADDLRGEPMLWLDAHWHYYKLCAHLLEGNLAEQSLLSKETVAIARSMGSPDLQWLGNVPMDALVRLREENQNEDFRRRLAEHTERLRDASIEEIDRVAAEVGRGIASLIAEHQVDVRRIEEQYKSKHAQTAVGSWITLAATFLPALAPFYPPAAAGPLLAKYGWDKVRERADKKAASRSLAGVLAAAKSGAAG